MFGPISLDAAWFFAVLVDTALCGAYTVIFVLTLWVARGRRWYLSPPFLVIYISYLLNLARTAILILTAYFTYIERPLDASRYFQDPYLPLPNTPLAAFDRYSWNALSLLGYVTLIWRVWIIWSKNIKIIVVPAILLIIAVMTSVLGVHPNFRRTACAVFGMEAVLNALLAVLISGKIWVAGRRPMFRRVAVVVLESGIIMSVGMVVTLITFAIGTNALVIAWAAMAKIMGMSATGIVLLLNLDVKHLAGDAAPIDTALAFQVEQIPASNSLAEDKIPQVNTVQGVC